MGIEVGCFCDCFFWGFCFVVVDPCHWDSFLFDGFCEFFA